MDKEDSVHWTDVAAEKVILEKGNKKSYTVAAGITPSGTVHIGNFREIITVDLVRRALEKQGKKVRFIYSWDDFDVFRKVPANMPKPEVLKQYLRKPIVETPDTFGCHKSYAEHHEKEVEEEVTRVGIKPEFLYQSKKYRAGEYAKEMKYALENTETIVKILNQYREEPLEKEWLPVSVFCEKCDKDTINTLTWSGAYVLSYECECGHKDTFDFKKKPGLVKLKWRVDWPMRWAYEQVDFEPGGKDHSTVGGSYDTGKDICKQVWNFEAPTYVMYDFISLKGMDGKMSSSKGEVITLKEVLEIYEPEVTRYLFAGTRPNREFAISFDADVINVYEEFDKAERIYFGAEQLQDEKKAEKYKIAYELSYIGKIPKIIPYQPKFRHLSMLLQINSLNIDKAVGYFEKELKNEYDKGRLRTRVQCAKNWLEKYAPEEFKFMVQEKCVIALNKEEKKLLEELSTKLLEKNWTDVELHEEIYILCKNHNIQPKDFFTLAYRVLINKEKGPRLGSFILEIGREKVAKLLKKVAISSSEKTNYEPKNSNYQPIKKLFEIDQEVRKKFPGLKVGLAIIKGVSITKSTPELEKFKKNLVTQLVEEFKTISLAEVPMLKEYIRIYKSTGVDPSKQKPSPLALLKRVKEGKELYTVNTLVDAYNLAVMESKVSMGAFDLTKLQFPTFLRFAKEGEEFTPLLSDVPAKINQGELVYVDHKGLIFCRDLNYRDSDFTKVTEKTKDVILYVDGTAVTSEKELQKALQLALKLIQQFCGGKVEQVSYTF